MFLVFLYEMGMGPQVVVNDVFTLYEHSTCEVAKNRGEGNSGNHFNFDERVNECKFLEKATSTRCDTRYNSFPLPPIF